MSAKRERELKAIRAGLEAFRVWVETPPQGMTDAWKAAGSHRDAIVALLAELPRPAAEFETRAAVVLATIDSLILRCQLEWARDYTSVYRDLITDDLHERVAALHTEATCSSPGSNLAARTEPVLEEVLALSSTTAWDNLRARVRLHAPRFPVGEDIEAGWTHLRDAFGDRLWGAFLRTLIANTTHQAVVGHGRLGLMLRDAKDKPGYRKLIERLLEDEPAVRGLLAEFGILWGLRSRGAVAQMLLVLGEETGETTCADIRVTHPAAFEIEVSFLGDPSPLTSVWDLEARISRGVREVTFGHPPLLVQVRCEGAADTLFRHVPDACSRLAQHLADPRPWTKRLAPGLEFGVSDTTVVTDVRVSGATVYTGDETANENPLRRLPTKVEKESAQVPDGGVVLICTSQLGIQTARERDDLEHDYTSRFYERLAEALRDVGTRRPNVAAFALLDSIGGDPPHPMHPTAALGPDAYVLDGQDALGHQRLLWVTNPVATRPISPQAAALFRPPLGIYP